MKKALFNVQIILLILLSAGIYSSAIAQKTNNVQSGSVWQKSPIKIDGRLTEWGDLKAYNKSTKIWYTLANDDKNIYLAIESTDQDIDNKILAGGISLSLNTDGRKKDKNAFVITFPVITRTGGGRGGRGRRGFSQQDTPDSAAIIAQQKQTLATGKVISVLGFKQITDTLISIYNEYGIKAAASFDAKGNYFYELAVPLNLLQVTADSKKEIAYNIKLNGLQTGSGGFSGGGGGRYGGSGGGSGGGNGFGGGGGPGFGSRGDSNPDDMSSPTDFWGKYTLATISNPQ